MNIKDVVFLIKENGNNKNNAEKLISKGVNEKNIVNYKDLFGLNLKTSKKFAFTLDANADLSDEFFEMFEEIEVASNEIGLTFVAVKSDDVTSFYNVTPLITGDYDNLRSYLDVTTMGAFIPVSALNNSKLKLIDGVDFYKDILFYKITLEDYDVKIIPKILLRLETDEYEVSLRDKEKLHDEMKTIMKNG